MTTGRINARLHAIELGEQYWEHDRLTLRSLTPAQRAAQLRARERLVRHARRVQHLVESRQIPGGDADQRRVADGIADLMQILWEHARDEASVTAEPVRAVRVPIPAPTAIWATTAAVLPAVPTAGSTAPPVVASEAVCRRCMGSLVRDPLAQTLGRPASQGWRHADGRKTHHPDPAGLGDAR